MTGPARPPVARGVLRRAIDLVGELLGVTGVMLTIPLAILAVGLPIVFFVRLLVWSVQRP